MPTKDLGALLREMRQTRQQQAVVVDEYGGTAGIVTMEDILEEIVGEIEGEYELPDDTLTRVDDHTLIVAGSMTIDDFNETVGTQLPQNGARTMAGLVFNALGRRPQRGDAVAVNTVRLSVEQMDGMRITRLRVELEPLGRPDERGSWSQEAPSAASRAMRASLTRPSYTSVTTPTGFSEHWSIDSPRD